MSGVFVTQSARRAIETLEPGERKALMRFVKDGLVDFAESQSSRKIAGIEAPVWVAQVADGPLAVFEKEEEQDRYVVLAVIDQPSAAALDAMMLPRTSEIGQSLLKSLAQEPPAKA